jgi:hypothetical protein
LIGGELVAGQLVVGTVAPGGDGLDLAVTEPVS